LMIFWVSIDLVFVDDLLCQQWLSFAD
jgi:hypothetical protein